MAVTVETLRAEVNAPEATDDTLGRLLRAAESLVGQVIGAADIPDHIRDEAVIVTAADLWAAREAPSGVRVFADGLGGTLPVRVRSNATIRARSILDPWLGPVIV